MDKSAPARLLPVTVVKPWGRELWYSAIESRGESQARVASGDLPLSRYLALADLPDPPLLLKVLDPDPAPQKGDLYLEVHREKREVYVVSRLHPRAWPNGCGRIRLGMNPARRRAHADDDAFRQAFLYSVQAYERVRRRLDGGTARPGDVKKASSRRAAMLAFTGELPVRLGDVIRVSPRMPHALQHGIRVVEFQTPSYERQIISFDQPTVTQAHWDSEAAIGQMRLDAPEAAVCKPVAPGISEIAAFEQFGVWRLRLRPGRDLALPTQLPYAICMAQNGEVQLGDLRLGCEEAALLPASAIARTSIRAAAPAACLVAAPGLQAASGLPC